MISEIIDIADYHPDLEIFRPDFNLRDLSSLKTEDQKKSYEYIAEQLRNDKVVDIGNNAYLDVFLHELIKELKLSFFRNDVKMLRGVLKRFEFIIDSYRHTQPGSVGLYYPWCTFVQLYLRLSPISTVNSWIESLSKHGWYSNSNDEIIALFVTFNKISASDYVDVNYFSFFAAINLNRFLTAYGQAHIEDILPIAHDLLQRDYQLSGQNYVHRMYTFAEENISFVEDYYGTLMLNSGYAVDVYEGFDRKFQVDAKVPRYTAEVRDAYVGSILKEAETILRDETGVERRWVSERLLYRQIDSSFTDITVLQHARPSFLKPQHYDVYLPDLKIALEYQGEQHFRAIPYFGGEEGLLRTQERDKRKREISVTNGVYQIDVLPGYEIASIVEDIASKKPGGRHNISELVEKQEHSIKMKIRK